MNVALSSVGLPDIVFAVPLIISQPVLYDIASLFFCSVLRVAFLHPNSLFIFVEILLLLNVEIVHLK
jgi:hypothetical protein